MNGLMAKLSMTELRARQGVCTSECPAAAAAALLFWLGRWGQGTAPEGQDVGGEGAVGRAGRVLQRGLLFFTFPWNLISARVMACAVPSVLPACSAPF